MAFATESSPSCCRPLRRFIWSFFYLLFGTSDGLKTHQATSCSEGMYRESSWLLNCMLLHCWVPVLPCPALPCPALSSRRTYEYTNIQRNKLTVRAIRPIVLSSSRSAPLLVTVTKALPCPPPPSSHRVRFLSLPEGTFSPQAPRPPSPSPPTTPPLDNKRIPSAGRKAPGLNQIPRTARM